jgi:hypothetical protein
MTGWNRIACAPITLRLRDDGSESRRAKSWATCARVHELNLRSSVFNQEEK